MDPLYRRLQGAAHLFTALIGHAMLLPYDCLLYTSFLINSPNVTAGKYDVNNTMKYDHNDFELICNQVTDSSCMAIRVDDDRYSDWESFANYWKQEGVMITSCLLYTSKNKVGQLFDQVCGDVFGEQKGDTFVIFKEHPNSNVCARGVLKTMDPKPPINPYRSQQ